MDGAHLQHRLGGGLEARDGLCYYNEENNRTKRSAL